ncbi:head decoration protein [Roseomonas terrae]|uniref:Head decoration protein n=1 Tax=Neoroseomonas terrae TaxID=424799 RepID=A0ABS5EER6_9PROT|nr:head decoration protein [Neoroseomonas terrae]MBR0649519.1 head decoration protein [Neoroseomonas terrae]
MSGSLVGPAVQAETYTPDKLLLTDYPVITRTVTILAGQTIQRGHLLGRITASGKYIISLSAASDGSQTPCAIAADNITTGGSDASTGVFEAGEFNEAGVILGTAHTLASVRPALTARGIHLKAAVAA